ncbi:MAG: hypothetical protein V1763_00650, partial [Parcubacteria group bacterium]
DVHERRYKAMDERLGIVRDFIALIDEKAILTWDPGTLPTGAHKLVTEFMRLAGFGNVVLTFKPFRGSYDLMVTEAETGKEMPFATSWLSQLAQEVNHRLHLRGPEERAGKTETFVIQEVQRSQPLAPIQLTDHGSMMEEFIIPVSHRATFFIDHKRDATPLPNPGTEVGLHQLCDYTIKRHRDSRTHDALNCSGCGLRVSFPRDYIATYGDLRKHFMVSLNLPR